MDQLAKETKFTQREGKITGSMFFALIVFNNEKLKEQSLNDLADDFEQEYGVEISKQALHKRFNNFATDFMKQGLEKLLNKQFDSSFIKTQSKTFNRILLKDSVGFQVDESLKDLFPGSGGSGSEAAIRIQFEYDLLNGKINDLSVNAFNDQDADNSFETINLTAQGDLIIRDLAYMSLKVIKQIIEILGYFLCRLNPAVNVYEKKDDQYQKLDFVKLKDYMKTHGFDCLEKEVYLGYYEKIKVRLIINLLPDEVVAERLRKAQKNNKKKGRGNLTKEYKARAALNLFVTNATQQQIPKEKVYLYYKLRWQIELAFKIWKSLCKIDKVKKVQRFRLECYIYAKLIFIVLGWQIVWAVAKLLFIKNNKALSFFKAFKTLLRKKMEDMQNIFLFGIDTIGRFLLRFYHTSKTKHLLEKKQQKPTSLEMLLNCLNS